MARVVFFCLQPSDGAALEWYYFHPPERIRLLARHAKGDDNGERFPGFTCVSCDSKLYAIGGGAEEDKYFYGNKNIMVFDHASSQFDGEFVPWLHTDQQLMQQRFAPGLAVKGNKIYIFGTFLVGGSPMPQPWGEVYDTKLGTILGLPQPPAKLLELTRELGDVAVYKNRILIQAHHHLFSYDTDTGEWNDISEMHPEAPNLCIATVVKHGFLITFSFGIISAYDFDNKICIQPIPGFEEVLNPRAKWEAGEGCLMELAGERLCLVWNTPKHCCSPADALNSVIFELNKTVSDAGLLQVSARIIYSKKYRVPKLPDISSFVAL